MRAQALPVLLLSAVPVLTCSLCGQATRVIPAEQVTQRASEVLSSVKDTLSVPIIREYAAAPDTDVQVTGWGALRGADMHVFAVRVRRLQKLAKWTVTLYLNADNDTTTGRQVNNGGVDYQIAASSGGGVHMFAWVNPTPGAANEQVAAKRFGVIQTRVPLAEWGLGAGYSVSDMAYVFILDQAFTPIPLGSVMTVCILANTPAGHHKCTMQGTTLLPLGGGFRSPIQCRTRNRRMMK